MQGKGGGMSYRGVVGGDLVQGGGGVRSRPAGV